MLTLTVVLFICAGSIALPNSGLNSPTDYSLEIAEKLFEEFIKNYDKMYNPTEKRYRANIFKENLKVIIEKNTDPEETATFKIWKYSDKTKKELSQMYAKVKSSKKKIGRKYLVRPRYDFAEYETLPTNWDWREHNAVQSVKDQDNCQSCWAFSITGAIEGAYAIKHHQLYNLSEEQLVNCAKQNLPLFNPDNCLQGYFLEDALEYLVEVGGLMTEEDYPYTSYSHRCKFDPRKVAVGVKGYLQYDTSNMREDDFRKILYKRGPVAISVDSTDLHRSPSNIFRKCSFNASDPLSHAVLLVGYGEENGDKYWIVKNSWGPEWGEGGYFRILRNVNNCGFMNYPAFSVSVY